MEKISISECQHFHIGADGHPLYEARFDQVQAFHKVGNRQVAPVRQGENAFHIDINGQPIYSNRFQRCFGFYDDLAAVVDESGWYHIDQKGHPLYPERYRFAGNYQENYVVVMEYNKYFHLDKTGMPAYTSRWRYCGDFRYGIAVVQASDGLSTHIRFDGTLLHDMWFYDLDVYHKGYARAKTKEGWCHIDKQGKAIYSKRFQSVEPFYNGFARCETFDGALVIMDESGNVSRQLRESMTDHFSELSADMVGYWKTYTIYAGVKLGIFEQLPATVETLSTACQCDSQKMHRLIRALNELGLVEQQGGLYVVTEKGSYLCLDHEKTLADAAIEYGENLLAPWQELPQLIQGAEHKPDIFNLVAADPERVISHHRMLASYAFHDYEKIVPLLPLQPGFKVLDAAGGTGTLATLLQKHFPEVSIELGDFKSVIAQSYHPNTVELDLFSDWKGLYDVIILARVLHDWPDGDAVTILRNAQKALTDQGEIYVLEMLLEADTSFGSVCDLHILAVTGGQERTLSDFHKLAKQAGLCIKKTVELPSLVSLTVLQKQR